MSTTFYQDLCLFKRMPNTNVSRKLIVEYIKKYQLAIKFKLSDSFQIILKIFNSFYLEKVNYLKSLLQSYIIRKKYNLLLSQYAQIPFRLSTDTKSGNLMVINENFPIFERKLTNTNNLIDGIDIRTLDPQIIFICRDKGNLYAFDLRELNQMKTLINPYTNNRFNQFNRMLINVRLQQCQKKLLKIDPIITNVEIKINSLISLLEGNSGYYIDINNFKNNTNTDLKFMIDNIIENNIINKILKSKHRKICAKLRSREKYIDLLLYIAKYQDQYQNERCLAISDVIRYGPDYIDSYEEEDDFSDTMLEDFDSFFSNINYDNHNSPILSEQDSEVEYSQSNNLLNNGDNDIDLEMDFDWNNLWQSLNPMTTITNNNHSLQTNSYIDNQSINNHSLQTNIDIDNQPINNHSLQINSDIDSQLINNKRDRSEENDDELPDSKKPKNK